MTGETPYEGAFITFEGGEGVGKSTQVQLLAEWLRAEQLDVVTTREPGGTLLGIAIRSVVLQDSALHCTGLAELFLMLADRAQDVARVILPALQTGAVVISDRFNDSSLVYQAMAHSLDLARVRECCRLAAADLEPDLTLLLDADPEVAMQRIRRDRDRMELKPEEFHRRVRQSYLELARSEPKRFVVIDATASELSVAKQVRTVVTEHIISGT